MRKILFALTNRSQKIHTHTFSMSSYRSRMYQTLPLRERTKGKSLVSLTIKLRSLGEELMKGELRITVKLTQPHLFHRAPSLYFTHAWPDPQTCSTDILNLYPFLRMNDYSIFCVCIRCKRMVSQVIWRVKKNGNGHFRDFFSSHAFGVFRIIEEWTLWRKQGNFGG